MKLTIPRAAKATGAAIVVALLALLGSSALTATNTVPASQAGDGANAITGYTVSDIDYALNATNPQNIDTVTFDLDSTPDAGSDIQIRLDASTSDWYSCTFSGVDVTCDVTSPVITVALADELRVVAVD